MSVEINDAVWRGIKQDLVRLTKLSLAVGILAEEGAKKHDKSDANIAQIAFWNEFGVLKDSDADSDEARPIGGSDDDYRTPERPAHRIAYEKNKTGLKRRLAGSIRLISEKKAEPENQLNKLGEWYVGQLKQEIISYNDKPNKESTVRRKGANNPLIDSGQTVGSIRHLVE